MKALAGSYFMFSPLKYREEDTLAWCSRAFNGHQKRFRVNVSLFAISSQNKCFHSISAASSADTQITDETENLQKIDTDQQKRVHVRFKLQKECAFGQQFLVVGDDPVIGLWEPSDGVPLNWSDGHFWTAQVDLPSNKMIKYKFILKGETGTISWQLGPDRVLETWDTDKTITVFEDWDNPELQSIVESDLSEEILVNSDLLINDDNLSVRVTAEGTNVEKEEPDTNGCTNIAAKASALLVAENIVERELDLSSDTGYGIGNVIDQKNEIGAEKNRHFLSSDNETRLVSDEGVPVLVPGLILMAPEEIEEALLSDVERENDESTTSDALNEVEELNVPELKDEHVSGSFHPTETKQEMIDKKGQQEEEEEEEEEEKGLMDSVLEGDKHWGRQTLRKLLANLGLQLS